MQAIKVLVVLGSLLVWGCFSSKQTDSVSQSHPLSHDVFDSLLKKNVTAEGLVDYKGFMRDSVSFNQYLDLLSRNHPNEKNWSREQRLAYWINVYNAFTIRLILDHYPIGSIKDIKKGIPTVSDTWTIPFIHIEEKTYSLNNIEHGIVRVQFDDPRVHFALNCASMSCPPLLNRAYTAEKLNAQLDSQARRFINDGVRNQIVSPKKAKLSKIFSWFGGDFKKTSPSVVAFINQYSTIRLDASAEIEYLTYDWGLNRVR